MSLALQHFLITSYSEPGRHYHNLNHIHFLLSKVAEWETMNQDKKKASAVANGAIQAVWWHDAHYSIWALPGVNEAQSADMYRRFTPIPSQIVYKAILATADHLKDQKHLLATDSVQNETIKLMLDVDLAGFAKDYASVQWDSENVLKELAPKALSRKVLLEGRLRFLERLYQRERLFYTDYFFDTHEDKARINIRQSIVDTKQELTDSKALWSDPIAPTEPAGITIRATVPPGIAEQLHANRNRFTHPVSGLAGYYIRGHSAVNGRTGYWLRYDDKTSWFEEDIGWLTNE